MGTWDVGPFDNDHVGDELHEFDRKRTAASGLKVIAGLLTYDWSTVVAGAELINIIRGHGKHQDDTTELEGFHGWVDRTNPSVPPELLAKARAALAAVAGQPQFVREWATPAKGKKWKKVSEDILRRLKLNR